MLNKLNSNFKNFKNKKVLITGHTGLKGSWLCLWLHILNAKILGISNSHRDKDSNYKLFNLNNKIIDKNFDIRNYDILKNTIRKFKPDYIFHLAAQALVKESYQNPKDTWGSNTIGTINILESLRELNQKCTVVMITSDKVYKNLEIKRGYTEKDILGGNDPYSASKASADIAINSYSKSFYLNKKIKVAIARAGNVVGGGDWSDNRLIPDCAKFTLKGKKVIIRNPNSTRPWQHVLDILNGYLTLANALNRKNKIAGQAFNFGPEGKGIKVIEIVKKMKQSWGKIDFKIIKKSKFKEAKLLKLNINKAKKILKWKCVLNTNLLIKLTADWYLNYSKKKKTIEKISTDQIIFFETLKWKKNP
tara:strand:- start:241 stop:1326 length:1086 start_codon:yes stop_codon:yes gene_type:complete